MILIPMLFLLGFAVVAFQDSTPPKETTKEIYVREFHDRGEK